ncbi:hypothetical protein SAMN05216345_110155 [Cupriavidus sp. YR651]|uniref:hypothetical protein n=1 Tax=Cupriavidus sp. YR651 TaxID=1855315 RepID=UPI000886A548|nr:hypothetical protein [Cupriavidus sp. YR651]SDD52731.1 hypothetical protein SAMN05216345_110155 [Cupriavidus sp. YR651]
MESLVAGVTQEPIRPLHPTSPIRIPIRITPGRPGFSRIACGDAAHPLDATGALRAQLALAFVLENILGLPQCIAYGMQLANVEVKTDVAMACALAMESTLCFLGMDARIDPTNKESDHD